MRLLSAGADEVAMTLRETRSHVMELIPLLSTLEPHPRRTGPTGSAPWRRAPCARHRQPGSARHETGFGSHGSTVAGLVSLPIGL
jgi:hypothetical protein